MALVLGFASLISLLNEGPIRIDRWHLLLTLFVELAAYLGWPTGAGECVPGMLRLDALKAGSLQLRDDGA